MVGGQNLYLWMLEIMQEAMQRQSPRSSTKISKGLLRRSLIRSLLVLCFCGESEILVKLENLFSNTDLSVI